MLKDRFKVLLKGVRDDLHVRTVARETLWKDLENPGLFPDDRELYLSKIGRIRELDEKIGELTAEYVRADSIIKSLVKEGLI